MTLLSLALVACNPDCPEGFLMNNDGLCIQVSDDSGIEGDADTDADSDTDSDSDADADSDTDTDTDADTDTGLPPGTWCDDVDGDTFGDPDACAEYSDQPEGTVKDNTDCDDARADVYPGAPTQCEVDPDVDWDCDGSKGSDNKDGDDFIACEDCDDTDKEIHPDAREDCATVGVDDNCDGYIDELEDPTSGVSINGATSYKVDADGDGHGDADGAEHQFCNHNVPKGPPDYVKGDLNDCDDTDPDINPDQYETGDTCYDTIDNDCSGKADLADCDSYESYFLVSDEGTRGAEDTDGDGSPDAGNASVDGSCSLSQQCSTSLAGDCAHELTGVVTGDELVLELDRNSKGIGGVTYGWLYTSDAVDASICFRSTSGTDDCSSSETLSTGSWTLLTHEFGSGLTTGEIVVIFDAASGATVYADAVTGTDK